MGEAGIDSFQELVEMNATLVLKQIPSWAKRCQPVIAEGKKGGDREEEIKDSHSTP